MNKNESLSFIRPAADARDYADIGALMREYLTELGVDLCFQDFEGEVADLPRAYAAPDGALLIARDATDAMGQSSNAAGCSSAAGCVALRRVRDTLCEMKRLYVQPAHRGSGLGRRLVEAALDRAREMGFSRVCLNTVVPKMPAAVALYRSMGFVEIEPFDCHPVEGTLAMGLAL